MSRTTLQNTLTELYGILSSDAVGTPVASLATAGCVKVYPHEPGAGGVVRPCSVTIDVASIDSLDWGIAVRVYVSDQDPARAQDLKINVPVAVDALMTAGYGPSRWSFDVADLSTGIIHLATCELAVGREDGF